MRPATLPPPTLSVSCLMCGAPILQGRRTRRYCSDRCRKAAQRTPDLETRGVFEELLARGFIGKVWPVYRWDETPAILGLLVPRAMAAAELGLSDERLGAVLRAFQVREGNVEERLIRDFYAARKDRKTTLPGQNPGDR